jgi:hypothetical protein
MSSKKVSAKTKKEIMIAILLTACLLLGFVVMAVVEDNIGTPIFYDGEMKNINVVINEICASNKSILATDSGEYPDYIELYNKGETFNLADFGLANDTQNNIEYKFGDYLFESGSYLIVYLDGVNVPFRLNSNGNEYIALVSWDGTVIDSVTTVKTPGDSVMLRTKDGFEISDLASPGFPNTEEGVRLFRAGIMDGSMALAINEIFSANDSVLPDFEGDYCDIVEIKNVSSAIVSTKGYYISDTQTDRMRTALPEKELAPGDIMLVFASGKEKTAENGEFHADFRISADEEIFISFGSKYTKQAATKCESNKSLSRVNGENGIEYVEMYATPGYENNENGREALDNSRINSEYPLIISELLLSQDGVPYGGKLRDVIEICNISNETVSTSGWFISDSQDDPYKFALPARNLAPNECMLLYAENGNGENVCGFALSSGEAVYLTGPDFKRSEYVSCAAAGRGFSRSYTVENGEAVYIDTEISIGFANGKDGVAAYAKAVRPTDIEISEVVSSNTKFLAGPYKTYHDFVELYNRTDKEIDLTGYYLSDDPEQVRKGSLDGVKVPANGYVCIILSTDGINTPKGYHVVNFSINASGETLVLAKGDTVTDVAVIPSLGQNTSFGRANGDNGFSILASPTPKDINSATATETSSTPQSSLPQGVYSEGITVELQGDGAIYYTLDCTEPTADSPRYTAPIKISSTTVIRCIAIEDGKKPSEYSNFTFIVNENDTLEAVSIVTTPKNLWDYYSGIYETGPKAKPNFPYEGANYYNRWEREATVSFFDKNGSGFDQGCGIRIFGGLSRALPKKSFALFFRQSYGKGELDYQLFEDDELAQYEAFVLRNGGQDFKYSTMKDAMVTSMAHDLLGIDTQNCRPVVLYLNGEYWGLYFIREKLNENYVAGHYNVDASEATVTVANGKTSPEYTELVNFAHTHDLRNQEHYDYMKSQMDIENYIDYIVAEMIICNTDNGNIRFFTYEGGKWRWIMYDVDQSFRTASYNTVSEHLNPAGTGSANMFSTRLINALLKNPEFKEKFLRETAYQLNNIWTVENVNAYVDTFRDMIINDIGKDCSRWERKYETWENSVNNIRSFISAREKYVVQHIQAYFNLSDSEMRELGFEI